MAHMATMALARQWADRKGCTISGAYQDRTPYLTVNKDQREIGRTLLDSWDGTPCVALHELAAILEPLPDAAT